MSNKTAFADTRLINIVARSAMKNVIERIAAAAAAAGSTARAQHQKDTSGVCGPVHSSAQQKQRRSEIPPHFIVLTTMTGVPSAGLPFSQKSVTGCTISLGEQRSETKGKLSVLVIVLRAAAPLCVLPIITAPRPPFVSFLPVRASLDCTLWSTEKKKTTAS